MADLCSHCLEIEAAIAERDREIERLRKREDWVDPRLITICEHKHYIRMADDTYAELDRLRSREAKWRELWALAVKQERELAGLWISRGITKLASDDDLKRATQLRRELGLDGEET